MSNHTDNKMKSKYELALVEAADAVKEANAKVKAARRAKARARAVALDAALLDLGRALALKEGFDLDPEGPDLEGRLARLEGLIEDIADVPLSPEGPSEEGSDEDMSGGEMSPF